MSYIFYITLLYTSIYNPPSKTQTIFNPSNYGGLGAGGQITTDYLDANYASFPIVQGNLTLVGTSILGDITQQGDFTTTGDITGDNINASSFLVGTTNLLTEIGTKQDELIAGTNISIVDDLVSCDLTGSTNIDITGGVISATGLQNELTGGTNISIVDDVVSCDLTGSTNIEITDGVISATGLATTTQLDTKQDTITFSTDLSSNSLNTYQIIVNENLFFNTIVIRRPTLFSGGSDPNIVLRELQCWVNDTNILFANSGTLNAYFASWLDNSVEIDPSNPDVPASNIHDNNILTGFDTGAIGIGEHTAIIIKNIPLTAVKDIQSLVMYNRDNGDGTGLERAEGLGIELYNTDDDANLETPLVSTNMITTAVPVYRYDFPSITFYKVGFSDVDSTTQIASETLALKEVVNVITDSVNITGGGLTCDTITTTGNVDIGGDLVVGLDKKSNIVSFRDDTFSNQTGNTSFVFEASNATNVVNFVNFAVDASGVGQYTFSKAGLYKIYAHCDMRTTTFNERVMCRLRPRLNNIYNSLFPTGYDYIRGGDLTGKMASLNVSFILNISVDEKMSFVVEGSKETSPNFDGGDDTTGTAIEGHLVIFEYLGA